jgi:hypothetical protein
MDRTTMDDAVADSDDCIVLVPGDQMSPTRAAPLGNGPDYLYAGGIDFEVPNADGPDELAKP